MVDTDPDQIIVVDYDPGWQDAYEMERRLLAKAFGDRAKAIEHIGSTAVPCLCAKPVIDIMVCVLDVDEVRDRHQELSGLGYVYVPFDDDGDRLFFRKGMPRAHHLHVVLAGGKEWERHIQFRNLLRGDDGLRERYSQLKRESAARHRNDRNVYLESKRALIDEALQRSKADTK
ncbi:MAG: GrpB family protein [Methanomassiliicoccales archaeon]